MQDDFYWINAPRVWRKTPDGLSVVTDGNTDFWQTTGYGFERFSGHGFVHDVMGDFTFQVRIQARFSALYDRCRYSAGGRQTALAESRDRV